MNLSWFKVLSAIAQEGSISAAATELHYTQSVVSRQLAQLERATGHTLVERSWKGAHLTPAGEKLLKHADALLDRIDLAMAELDQGDASDSETTRELTLASYQHPLATFVPEAIGATRRRLLDTRVQLRVTTPKMAAEQVLEGTTDVAVTLLESGIHTAPLRDPDIESWKLFDDTLVCALPAGHRLAGQEAIDLADLADEPWALGPAEGWCPLYRDFRRACERDGFTPKRAFELEDMFARVGLVVSQDVLTIVPWSTINELPTLGAVFRPFTEPIHIMVAVITRRSKATGSTALLVQELLRTAGEHAAIERQMEPLAA